MHTYSAEFYRQQEAGSLRSARRVLPILRELVAPRSIVDIGCGTGSWLAVARELGVADVVGVDGTDVDTKTLQIPGESFRAIDLSRPFSLGRTFDVALSLEVAEHLPETSAFGFVESLVRLAPIVMFSAAVPGQTGEHHVNEQWQSWWVDRFGERGYEAFDCIRPQLWNDVDIEWWYAQNTLLMVERERARSLPQLARFSAAGTPCNIVHPRAFLSRLAAAESLRPRGPREWLAMAPAMLRATFRRRFPSRSRHSTGRD